MSGLKEAKLRPVVVHLAPPPPHDQAESGRAAKACLSQSGVILFFILLGRGVETCVFEVYSGLSV